MARKTKDKTTKRKRNKCRLSNTHNSQLLNEKEKKMKS